MVLLLLHTLTNHRSCKKYQVFKDYDIPQGKIGADGKEASILVSATANTSMFCFMISRRFSNLFLIEFTLRYDSITFLGLLKACVRYFLSIFFFFFFTK